MITPKPLPLSPQKYDQANESQFRRAVDQHIREDVALHLGSGKGRWTPVPVGITTSGTFVCDLQVGHYTRVGNLVVFSCRVSVQSVTVAPTGDIYIDGLPFAAINITGAETGCAISQYSRIALDAGYTQLSATINPGESRIQLVENGSGLSASGISPTLFGTDAGIIIGGTYLTDG